MSDDPQENSNLKMDKILYQKMEECGDPFVF